MFDALIPAGFPRDHFWLADDGRVYAASVQTVLSADDAGFVAWRSRGGLPTVWPRDAAGRQTEAALQEVVAPYGLAVGLDGLKLALMAQVDAGAEEARGRWLTPGAGQAMEYQEVRAQGQAALAAPTKATPERFPMLAATIGIDIDPETKAPATDILGVARGVVAAGDAWLAIGTRIRTARLKGKAAIEAADSIEAARAAFDAIDWGQSSG